MSELVLAVYLMSVGLCVAGAGTHLYQWGRGEQAMLRFDGRTVLGMLGHLAMSFLCGPYILLQMGWQQQEPDGSVTMTSVLLSSLVSFGWAFITGLLVVAGILAIV
jgi:hypothetical protein